jgi:hypothetical protein
MVEYLPENQLRNHMNGVKKVNLHSSSQIHLDIPCSGLEDSQVP